MTLYSLRKKIQERLDFEIEFTKEDPEQCSKRIGNSVCASYVNQLKELDEEIQSVEFRLSQLEKELQDRLTKEGPQDWERELIINSKIDELRLVLGE